MHKKNRDRLHFDTATLPERDRFPAFCENFMRRYVALDIVDRGSGDFRARLDIQRVGAVDVAAVAGSPVSLERTRELMRDGNDGVAIVLCRDGVLHFTQCGREQRLQRGEAVVCDNDRLGGLHALADIDVWAIEIPRARLAVLVPDANDLGGRKLADDRAATRLLFSYLEGLSAEDMILTSPTARLFGDHLIDLVAHALEGAGAASETGQRPGVREARLAAVLDAIKRGFSDADFSAAGVAANLGITPRYVHNLLEDSGRTFSEYVLQTRLDRAAQLLCDPRRDSQRIGDIAFEVGFTDLSHFNRSFRRRFGDTPRAMREEAKRGR
jgi:AraC-like DNA-binding protein